MYTTNPPAIVAVKEEDGWIAYCVPSVVFGLLTTVEGWFPVAFYPLLYAAKIAAVSGALLFYRTPLRDIQPRWTHVVPSLLVGTLVAACWVVVDELITYPHLGSRVGFDPTALSPWSAAAFITIRLFGLVLVVPVMEELFSRSFVIRFATRSDFLSIQPWQFSLTGFAVMLALSSIAHPEWLTAIIANSILGLWLWKTRSVFAVVVTHATANALLGVYILTTHDWRYW